MFKKFKRFSNFKIFFANVKILAQYHSTGRTTTVVCKAKVGTNIDGEEFTMRDQWTMLETDRVSKKRRRVPALKQGSENYRYEDAFRMHQKDCRTSRDISSGVQSI